MESDFYIELKKLLNSQSRENLSDTPDFLLARYLEVCLANFENIIRARDDWNKE